jgi:hypothetical protein
MRKFGESPVTRQGGQGTAENCRIAAAPVS